MVEVVFGRRIVWGESVTEDEHRVGLAAYEAALEDGLRGLYPDAWISVQGEGHDSAARVTVDGEDVSETPRVVRVLEEAFSTGCDAIDALNDRLYLLRDEALAAGNTAQVALCDAALGGDSGAYARCIAALDTASAWTLFNAVASEEDADGGGRGALPPDVAEKVAEADRLRKLFDDAGEGQFNVLALVESYQRNSMEADERLRAVRKLLEENGCECPCDHHPDERGPDCEVCLACRVGQAVGK